MDTAFVNMAVLLLTLNYLTVIFFINQLRADPLGSFKNDFTAKLTFFEPAPPCNHLSSKHLTELPTERSKL